MNIGSWGFAADTFGESQTDGEELAAPAPKLQPVSALRVSSFGPSGLQLRAANLLLNQVPSDPYYTTAH